jgi:hypothetical protein
METTEKLRTQVPHYANTIGKKIAQMFLEITHNQIKVSIKPNQTKSINQSINQSINRTDPSSRSDNRADAPMEAAEAEASNPEAETADETNGVVIECANPTRFSSSCNCSASRRDSLSCSRRELFSASISLNALHNRNQQGK